MSKKRIKSRHCFNCGYEFRIEEKFNNYCPNCGQENHNPRQPLLNYVYGLAESLIHFDSRTWFTLRTLLFSPGTMTKEFRNNIRARYTPPVKIFVFSLAIFIVILEAAQDTMVKMDVKDMRQMTLQQQMSLLNDNDLIAFSKPFFTGDKVYFSVRQLKELQQLEPSQIGNWLKTHNLPYTLIYRLEARMVRNNIFSHLTVADFNRHIVRIHYYVIFIMVPISAFLIFLGFYRKGLFFYDAMIQSIHLYAFALILAMLVTVIVLFLISQAILKDTTIVLPFVMFISLTLNFIPAYKKVFEFSWPSTIVRGCLVGLVNMSVQILLFWFLAAYIV